jgi:hypothetical protein
MSLLIILFTSDLLKLLNHICVQPKCIFFFLSDHSCVSIVSKDRKPTNLIYETDFLFYYSRNAPSE